MEEFYLVNGEILDVRTGKFIKADLKITGKQIASVQEKAPTEAKKVDCSGKYLIPGIMVLMCILYGKEQPRTPCMRLYGTETI